MRIEALNIDRDALLAQTLRGDFPDARGRFGPFGGRYVPETLVPALDRLEEGVRNILPDAALAQVPAAKTVKYTVVKNQLLLIDPTNMRVVDIISQ